MQGIFNLPESLKDDLDRFKIEAEKFKNGQILPAEFQSFRVPQGVYEQHEEGTYMLRVRLAAGGVLPHQMRTLASVSRKYGNGILHVTTRQDIQIHRVLLDDIHPALTELYESGLSTKGGGGNTVRNITACYSAGVCGKEAFDISPYAVSLTEFMLPDPMSYKLPRKYKIAFSGCQDDCAGATVNDLGFIAKKQGDRLGFAVHIGGGLGANSRVATLFEAFVPAEEVYRVSEAVKRVFDKYGNRKNRNRARLRFLIEQIGLEKFRELYKDEMTILLNENLATPEIRELPKRSFSVPETPKPALDGFSEWRKSNSVSQKQEKYYMVHIPLPLGDISADTLEKLSYTVDEHGEGMARSTQWQNLVIHWVHENELTALHGKLLEIGLGTAFVPILHNTVACIGASTCNLGMCLSRGLARAIVNKISCDVVDLDKLGQLSINISGCPNSCGRHPIGQIGLFGIVRRIGERLVPHYVIQLGGKLSEGRTTLAQGKEAIPAKNVPAFINEFLKAYQESDQFPDYNAFLDAKGRGIGNELAAKYKYVPSFEEDKSYYFDWDAELLND